MLAAPLGQAVAQPRPASTSANSRSCWASLPWVASTSTNRKWACGIWAIAGSVAAMIRMTSASTTGDRSGPKWAAGTVIPSSPLASRAASSAYGTAPARSLPITPLAIEAA